MIAFSPMLTLGPMIEFFISQPGAMLTGGMMMVFSNPSCPDTALPHFFSSVALLSSNVSFFPQSNQLDTLNVEKTVPELTMQSSAGVNDSSSCTSASV